MATVTKENLNNFLNLKKECELLDQLIKKKKTAIVGIKKHPHENYGGATTDFADILAEIEELEAELEKTKEMRDFAQKALNEVITSITDALNRKILKCKHVKGLTWAATAAELSWSQNKLEKRYANMFERVLIIK